MNVGIFTRSIDDAALVLNVLTGADETLDSTSVLPEDLEEVVVPESPSVKGLTIGIPKEYFHPALHRDVADVWRRTTNELQAAGIDIF